MGALLIPFQFQPQGYTILRLFSACGVCSNFTLLTLRMQHNSSCVARRRVACKTRKGQDAKRWGMPPKHDAQRLSRKLVKCLVSEQLQRLVQCEKAESSATFWRVLLAQRRRSLDLLAGTFACKT